MSDNTNNGFPVPEEPLTREEQYLSAIAGVTPSSDIPEKPLTRIEAYLNKIVENGEGGGGGGGFTPTQEQLDAMNSGATTTKIEQIETNKNNILSIGSYSISPNIFDKSQVVQGKSLQSGKGKTYNDLTDNAATNVSGIIAVKPNAVYCGNMMFLGNDTAKMNLYTSAGSYIAQLAPYFSVNGINYYQMLNNAAYVRFTYNNSSTYIFNENAFMLVEGDEMPLAYCPYGVTIITDSNVGDIMNYIVNPCDYVGNDAQVFNKCLCIGDSITQGTFNYKDGSSTAYVNIEKYSYPTFLTKISGIETTNMGVGGYTSVEWWNAKQSVDFSGHDLCIINHGINDTLENVSKADTKTALTNIVNAVKAANTGIKIFLATVVPAYADNTDMFDNTNAAIKEVASETGTYFIDLTRYSHVHKGSEYEAGHLSAYGYWRLAKDYIAAIGYIMRLKPNDFKYVQFIGTNYTP